MKIILFCVPILLSVYIFKNWFTVPFITASDFPYFFRETIAEWSIILPVWDSTQRNGFGEEHVLYALDSYIYFLVGFFVNIVGLPWELVYKIFIFGLFILLSVYSSIYLVKRAFDKPSIFQITTAPLLFVANTYILMVVDGGQIGVALAYSIAPLVVARFIILVQNSHLVPLLIASFVLAAQIMFDARVALLTLGATVAYLFFYILVNQLNKKSIAKKVASFFSAIFLSLLLHLSWILPTILTGGAILEGLTGNNREEALRKSFEYFSFAQFSQTLSLLHPNWPENIFGKTYFMRPEFLVLPILAFSSLLFINKNSHKKNKQIIIFFPLLALIGAFLAKGANPPFEEINMWIFMHMPLSEVFRDSTKFYLYIALSYSILIPYSIDTMYNLLKSRFLNYFPNVFALVAFFLLLVLIHPVFSNDLRGTFRQHTMPNEYLSLKDFLVNQPSFSRTLWIPKQQRFNFYSYEHPAVSAEELFNATNSAEILMQFRNEKTIDRLANLAIQYIIVPYDAFGEIFVQDRKYNEKEYEDTREGLKGIPGLEKLEGFGRIDVYKITKKASDHFRVYGEGNMSYVMRKPDRYDINIFASKPLKLIFVENYNPYWIAKLDSTEIKSERTKDNLNSFVIEKPGNYSGEIYFSKQNIYNYGRIVSLVVLATFIVSLFIVTKSYPKG